jgi:hypothetical protein
MNARDESRHIKIESALQFGGVAALAKSALTVAAIQPESE